LKQAIERFFTAGVIATFSIVIGCRFLRSAIFGIIHRYILLQLNKHGKVELAQYSTRYQWLAILDAILKSTDSTIINGAVSREVAVLVLKLWLKVLLRGPDKNRAIRNFREEYGTSPPAFLVISPGKSCNLECSGCYANSDSREVKLQWDMVNKIVEDAKNLWGIKLVTFSGGEPMLYSSESKGILDIVQANPDLLFLMFTNGTLIDRNAANRMKKLGNLTPAISVEGLEKTTDMHRGKGIFKRILDSMEYIREAGVPCGISVTVDRNNINEVSSDKFFDFFFLDQNIFYAFYFQYLPIGRAINMENMPLPEQRIKFYDAVQEIVRRKRYFIIDFWNHGNLVNGCIAAGRQDGYLYIDWDGKVMPCVFMPYSAGNIINTYKRGESLNDLWRSGFFSAIRDWQRDYSSNNENDIPLGIRWAMPCPFRDHHEQFIEWVSKFQPEPEDAEADKSISSEAYNNYLCEYGRRLNKLMKSEMDKIKNR
jgi:MoaA/NifB/PqqE/SkfB family radical SAM enzyme